MFNSLSGRLSGHDYPYVHLETGGVEWRIEVSATTFQEVLSSDRNDSLRVLVYPHVREDQFKLFGFFREAERRAFLELVTVPGIGPRQALRILSGTTVQQLTQLLEAEDVQALTRIPGLGTKTAQKMILQLKGHLVLDEPPTSGTEAGPGKGGPLEELLTALVEMGYDRSTARAVLERVYAELTDSPETGASDGSDGARGPHGEELEQELFRRAIQELSRG